MARPDLIRACPIDRFLNDPRCAYCRTIVGLYDDRTVFVEIGEWGAETFPASTDHSKLTHLFLEVGELKARPASGEEMADVVMLVSHLAYAHGVDLMAEIRKKLEICRARTWGEPDADGVVEHVRLAAAPAQPEQE
jgi:NTP pyrophosphatase (non-canonical NTP hydrolase)